MMPEPVAKQYWSRGGVTPEIRSEIETFLSDLPQPGNHDVFPENAGDCIQIKAWQDRGVSQQAVSSLANELKRYCTAPRYTKYVRDQLKKAGVIK